jgi:hypothetical protein
MHTSKGNSHSGNFIKRKKKIHSTILHRIHTARIVNELHAVLTKVIEDNQQFCKIKIKKSFAGYMTFTILTEQAPKILCTRYYETKYKYLESYPSALVAFIFNVP